MSLDKAEKSTGTRHKARECALHLLFANDLVRPADFSVRDYWGELGFEQFHKGANELIWNFLAQTDSIEKSIDLVRTLVKNADNLGKNSTRFEDLRELDLLNERLRAEYRSFVGSIIENASPDSERVRSLIAELHLLFDKRSRDFRLFLESDRARNHEEEAKEFAGICARTEKTFVRLEDKILPAIDEMISTIKPARDFADRLAFGTISRLGEIDDTIRTRAEHWRIERMAIVDRNVLRLAVYELHYEDTPDTVVINEALEIARRFSTFEATQFINGILDAIRQDGEGGEDKLSQASSQ
jgi:transcription antitermination factor NusB